MRLSQLTLLSLAFCCFSSTSAQEFQLDSAQMYSKRKRLLIGGTSVLYASSLYGLHQLWYSDYSQGDFQFFNDNRQWLGVDKVGHSYTAYVTATAGIKAFEWAGYNKKQSAYIGGSIGWLFLTTVEVFDGYSTEWGFSYGDILANTVGSSLAIAQYMLWDQQILRLKFSYQPSDYREIRPEILGDNEVQGIIKDYNGQTYWASINLNAINSRIQPEWLNLALGYGARGMIYANADQLDTERVGFDARRHYYLSLDVDFERIPTRKKWLKSVFYCLNFFKLPFPSLQITEGQGAELRPLYF